ncbi:beta-ketoacyl-ACP synthase III [candidate division GN15 bacterium]|nr:beta-ketoacyl-ACP synthase III [candidate division GN15 bacterium]
MMQLRRSARITGTGSSTPPQRLTNADLEKRVETSDEWITSRTGIKERRIADGHTATSDLCLDACTRALDMAGVDRQDIELLIVATVTPDYQLPSTACVVQEKLSLPNAVAIDIAAACTGFITGLTMVRGQIEAGLIDRALVVGGEKLSSIVDWEDRATCVLFGDGAGAAVVTADNNGHGVKSSLLKSNGSFRELLWIPSGGAAQPIDGSFSFDGSDKIQMSGSEVFKVAVREMCNAGLKAIDMAGLEPPDIDLVVPHQANIRIIEALIKRLGIDRDKVLVNIEKYGNTSAASVPLALDEANRSGRIQPGDNVLMVAFGGGLIWGATVVNW